MPTSTEERIGNCPVCGLTMQLNVNGSMPWHNRRLADNSLVLCDGIGKLCSELAKQDKLGKKGKFSK